ncbi:hypothetical protein PV417_25000 [Streptomyces sp. ME19-03-3]|nr:hypothetical protein [Streptomyces sp. ME19-03-3]
MPAVRGGPGPAAHAAGRGDGATYPAEAPTERIDAIHTIDQVKPLVTRVVRTDPTASEHLPLIGKVLVTP